MDHDLFIPAAIYAHIATTASTCLSLVEDTRGGACDILASPFLDALPLNGIYLPTVMVFKLT